MPYSLNKVMVLGNLGQDPETRFSQAGNPITRFSVATTRRWRDSRTNENREETEWHNIVCFGRVAEIASEYLKKGKQCYVEGELRTSSWERDGVRHSRTEINARDLILLGGGGGGGGASSGNPYRDDPPRSGHSSRQSEDDYGRSQSRSRTESRDTDISDDDLDDDIPF